MSLADLLKSNTTSADPVILKVNPDKKKTHEHEKRPGFLVLSGWLATGEETFCIIRPEEIGQIPEKDGYVDLTKICCVKTNRIGKHYIERLNPVEQLNKVDFSNPF